jgi:ammonium transporter Rh
MAKHHMNDFFHTNHRASALAIGFQVMLIVLYGIFVRYETDAGFSHGKDGALKLFSYLQEIHIMIFIGFGFLMTFLKRYCYGAIGFNFFVAALVIQWDIWIES